MGKEELFFGGPPAAGIRLGEHGPHAGGHLQGGQQEDGVPQLEAGLPLEIYCFTSDTRWAVYEGIQSDIFDHLFAIIPEFGLRVFQHPSGADMRALGMRLLRD